MPINRNWPPERRINLLQLRVARFRHRCAPATLGTGMDQSHRTMNLLKRQPAQPREPFFSQRFPSRRRHFFNQIADWRPAKKLRQRLRPKEHLIGIAKHPLPAEIANLIDNFHGTRSAMRQIAAVEDQVGRSFAQIRQHCVERSPIPVNIGYNRDAQANKKGTSATDRRSCQAAASNDDWCAS